MANRARGVDEKALLWPAMRTAGRYDSIRFRVRDAVQAKDRAERRVARGVASNRRVSDAGTVLEAIVV